MNGRRAHDPARGLRECSRARSAPEGRQLVAHGAPQAAFASAVEALAGLNKFHPAPAPVDLFGEPVDPRRGLVGRPRHMPGDRQRAKVAELRAAGFSHTEIAAAIGITAPTLRLNYPIELRSKSEVWKRRIAREGSE